MTMGVFSFPLQLIILMKFTILLVPHIFSQSKRFGHSIAIDWPSKESVKFLLIINRKF